MPGVPESRMEKCQMYLRLKWYSWQVLKGIYDWGSEENSRVSETVGSW